MSGACEKYQIPPDLVVKYQPLDIAEVILSLIRRQTSSKRCGETGNHGLSCSPHLRTIGLPLNPMECGLACGRRHIAAVSRSFPVDLRVSVSSSSPLLLARWPGSG